MIIYYVSSKQCQISYKMPKNRIDKPKISNRQDTFAVIFYPFLCKKPLYTKKQDEPSPTEKMHLVFVKQSELSVHTITCISPFAYYREDARKTICQI